MRYTIIAVAALAILAVSFAPAAAEKGPVETVLKGCKTELETYCKDVTPGEGRILACLYAHGDKLSGRCEFALYDAAAQLERAVEMSVAQARASAPISVCLVKEGNVSINQLAPEHPRLFETSRWKEPLRFPIICQCIE